MCAGIFSIAEGYAMEDKKKEKISIKKERKPLQLIKPRKENKNSEIKVKNVTNKKNFSDDFEKENKSPNKTKLKKEIIVLKKLQTSKKTQKNLAKDVTSSKEEATLEEPKTPKKSKNDEDGETIRTFSPLLNLSPESAEREYFNLFRFDLVRIEYLKGQKKCTVLSPEVRKIYRKNDPKNYYTRKIQFQKETIFQGDHLFNPEDKILNKLGLWETNLERMKHGMPPIAHKGIISEKESSMLKKKEIKKKQEDHRIELHHFTQKSTRSEEDPIGEMTRPGHRGCRARFILKIL